MSWAMWLGLARSLLIYHGIPFRKRRLRKFYGQFIQSNDLCFDIGAHVGSRLGVWASLGAKIVAVEPQPICWRFLQRVYGRHPRIILRNEAVGAIVGTSQLLISERHPTVSTLSATWQRQVRGDQGFATVQWNKAIHVAVTTLDTLIAQYGTPAFCKIDVEGYEQVVLRGLTQPLPRLSFEYLPATLPLAHDCITHLETLGAYQYNWSVAETHHWRSPRWLTAAEMHRELEQWSTSGQAGDIYAHLVSTKSNTARATAV